MKSFIYLLLSVIILILGGLVAFDIFDIITPQERKVKKALPSSQFTPLNTP